MLPQCARWLRTIAVGDIISPTFTARGPIPPRRYVRSSRRCSSTPTTCRQSWRWANFISRRADSTRRSRGSNEPCRVSVNAAALVGLGKIAASQEDFDTAVRCFETALSLQPTATSIHYPLAMAYRGKGDLANAAVHLQKRGDVPVQLVDPLLDELVELKVGVRYYEKRGVAAGEAGNFPASCRAELRKAVEADSADFSSRVNLGTALANLGETDAAIDEYRIAIDLEPTSPTAHCNLGKLLMVRSEDEALEHLGRAVELDPEYAEAHSALADLLARRQEHARAAKHYGRAVEIEPRRRRADSGRSSN